MGVKNLWPNTENNICGIFLLTYKLTYLNVTVILLLICRGTYRAYIIMRMSSLAFQYRNCVNEF